MKISAPNALFRSGDFQDSLVGYIEYSIFSALHKGSIAINIEAARRKLRERLLGLANLPASHQAPHTQPVPLALPAVPLFTGTGHEPIRSFWRLDCVIAGNPTAVEPCPGFQVHGQTVQPVRDPQGRVALHTAVFQLKNARCFSDRFTGSAKVRDAGVAWSVRRLNEREFLANLLDESRGRLPQPSLHGAALTEDVLLEALLGCTLATSGADHDEEFLRLLLRRHRDHLVVVSVASPARSQGAAREVVRATVQDRHALARDVNFHFEGAKHYHGMVFVHGWMLDPMSRVSSIRARTSDTDPWRELLQLRANFERPDVEHAFGLSPDPGGKPPGFVACFELLDPCAPPARLEVVVTARDDGRTYVEQLPVADLREQAGAFELLMGIVPEGRVTAQQCRHFYRPLFTRCLQTKAGTSVSTRDFLGCKDPRPERASCQLSIIIPLYGPKRFETTQLPLLASLRKSGWQIVLALDDPAIGKEVLDNAYRLSLNYSVDLRVVCAASNLGFAGINNQAARAADGKHLLFLNSDCFITDADPVERAMAWLDQDESHGACGFRLHYADMRIQHDGMSDGLLEGDPLFHLNLHPRIGTPASSVPREVQSDEARLLTAACVMMKAAEFRRIGGFDECYLRGDFEDSDLCLKLLASGRKLGIVRLPGIFHLERQSIGGQDSGLRQKITLVNSWLYSLRWGSSLEQPLPQLELVA